MDKLFLIIITHIININVGQLKTYIGLDSLSAGRIQGSGFGRGGGGRVFLNDSSGLLYVVGCVVTTTSERGEIMEILLSGGTWSSFVFDDVKKEYRYTDAGGMPWTVIPKQKGKSIQRTCNEMIRTFYENKRNGGK